MSQVTPSIRVKQEALPRGGALLELESLKALAREAGRACLSAPGVVDTGPEHARC